MPQAMPCSAATSDTARFVRVTAAVTLSRSRPVSRERRGSSSVASVNERLGHAASTHR